MYICKNHFYHILISPKNILSFRTNFVKCVNLLRPVGGHERPGRVVGVGHRRRHVSPRKVSAQTSRREPPYHASVPPHTCCGHNAAGYKGPCF